MVGLEFIGFAKLNWQGVLEYWNVAFDGIESPLISMAAAEN